MATTEHASERTYLSDYRPPDYYIPRVDLVFDLDENKTRVRATLQITRNGVHSRPLVLNGERLILASLNLNGQALGPKQWHADEKTLTLNKVPESFTLIIETIINPAANSELSGLYSSRDTLCTQCEPEGFRRITYFLDRPDVLSVYRVTVRAAKKSYPVLLANGNEIETREDGAMHQAVWDDPHPKPCYLFALVAGQLQCIEDSFRTRSGREVKLRVYARERDLPQCGHAMAALRDAMDWDEKAYGREYDLDQYNIVAVEDFNMGAMENKGLNVFNTKYVLALPATATDHDYRSVSDVIGHEYFHNWSGNRVTLRDWFQLSLKEGFTVFREQQFSAAQGSAGVKRIEDANLVRTQQFREDAGPMAHPVRPESFVEINNFYTLTVYIKGAEVVRMLNRLVGDQTFQQGCALYFDRHDGQAVTTEEFIRSIEAVSKRDLTQFRLWYERPGTPRLLSRGTFDAAQHCYRLQINQASRETSEADAPLQMPIVTALFDIHGKPLKTLCGDDDEARHEHTLNLTETEQVFVFREVNDPPVPSILRGFSAPVMLETDHSDADLAILMGHDNDPFNRWDAGQRLARKQILNLLNHPGETTLDESFIEAFGQTLKNEFVDLAFQAFALRLPEENYLSEFTEVINPDKIHNARRSVAIALARRYREPFLAHYHALKAPGPCRLDVVSAGKRALRNICLAYLMTLEEEDFVRLALEQLKTADNMTDALAALALLADSSHPARDEALMHFYELWREYPLVIDKWLRVQAVSRLPDTVDKIKRLSQHECYQDDNPNKVHALIGAFSHANPLRFHQSDGSGYQLVVEQLLAADSKNPQVAARLASAFNLWRRFEPARRDLMQQALERIRAQKGLSRDVGEIIDRALAD